MYVYKHGGKQGASHYLDIAEDLVVVRTKDEKKLDDAIASKEGKTILSQLSPISSFPEAQVTVLQCKQARNRLSHLRDRARTQFKKEKDVRFAGRVLRDKDNGAPVVYTENFFVKFKDGLSQGECEKLINKHNLRIKKKLKYAANAYFVAAQEGTGLRIFQIAQDLLDEEQVELCHPELIRQVSRRAVAPQQWHLKESVIGGVTVNAHVNLEAAWETTKGKDIVIAIIDDGIDIDHDEFTGAGKIVAPKDVTQNSDDPRPKDRFYPENHGTACAGVACAEGKKASGVAPEAKLMPIRLVSNLGSQAEADAFEWATDHGADIISCSWGPADGQWWNPNDATHTKAIPLPDSTRLAIDYAVNTGRNGRGCVIMWAAGNGNENVENDGYASYDKVIAVAACNDRNKRSVYSDFGESVWVTFPSSDFGYPPFNHPQPRTPGIWTTDREGELGYNPGVLNPNAAPPPGDDHGNYTEQFGGTSSACPGVAGVAALILAVNPNLRWNQVKDILRHASVRIDSENGSYNSDGHSPFYGYGRPDAAKAVQLALADSESDQEQEMLSLSAKTSGELEGTGAEKIFAIHLPAAVKIAVDGPGDVDFDLYVKKGRPPTTTDFDQRAWTPGPDEILKVTPNAPGLYYVLVRSYRGSGAFSLEIVLE